MGFSRSQALTALEVRLGPQVPCLRTTNSLSLKISNYNLDAAIEHLVGGGA
jgi:hypothetical protein